jgi:glycosyltransferase involved in cell wall biosynthesis
MSIRLAINVVSIKPSGALTVLLGLLEGWKRNSDPLDVTIFASDPGTLAAVRQIDWVDCVEPGDVGRSIVRQYLWQNYALGQELRRRGAQLLLTNNHYLFNIPCPQIVHHHNAWRFVSNVDVPHEHFSVGNAVRDWTARKALRSAERNVFVSGFLRTIAEKQVPSSAPRNVVIRNALDDDVVHAAETISRDQPLTSQILVVQSANIHKDNPTVLRTLAELVARRPDVDWQVKIAGSDGRSNRAQLRDLAEQLGIADRVTWLGFCSKATLDQLFRESLCLLSTSILEAGPLPVIETMARCCPPVAARIPSVEEFVGDCGLLVDPHRGDLFAEQIIRLYSQPELRRTLVDRGLQRIKEFTWGNRARQFCEVFAELTEAGGSQVPVLQR